MPYQLSTIICLLQPKTYSQIRTFLIFVYFFSHTTNFARKLLALTISVPLPKFPFIWVRFFVRVDNSVRAVLRRVFVYASGACPSCF
jgi:hypothetical protein